MFYDLMPELMHSESIYRLFYLLDLLLLFHFLAIQETLRMICLFSNLFYEDYNTINQQTIKISMLLLIECIVRVYFTFLEEIELIRIFN